MADRHTFNWMMSPTTPSNLVSKLITDLGDDFATNLGQINTKILTVRTGYQLVFSDEYGENQIHPTTCEGAGEVLPEHGYIPILFFATLRQRMNDELSALAGKFTFCTEEGDPISLDGWPELKAELERLGIVQEGVRVDAEAIGFVDPIYLLNELGDNEPTMFF